MTTILSVGAVVLFTIQAWLLARSFRRRHRDAVTAAYCEGFRDGVAYEAKAQVAQSKRALVRAGMCVN